MSFTQNIAGSVATTFALILVPTLLAIGIAIDYSRASNSDSHLKHAADAAALAAVAMNNATDQQRIDMAQAAFSANFTAPATATPAVTVAIAENRATVSATSSVTTTILGIAGIDKVDVGVTSIAVRDDGHPICLLALDPSAANAISLVGTSDLTAIDCAVHANSSHSSALSTNGTTDAEAAHFCAVGGSAGGNFSPAAQSGCPEVQDPYEGLAAPSTSGCDYVDHQFKNGTFTAYPGVYCGGLSLKTHADVTFTSGIYVMKNGPFTIDAQSSATSDGDGVFFYLTGDDTLIDVQGGADLDFTAFADGSYAGLIFAQDETSNPGAVSNIIGGGSIRLVGTTYLPTQSINIGGAGTVGADSLAWSVIAGTITLIGNADIEVRLDQEAAGLPPSAPTLGGAVRLIE